MRTIWLHLLPASFLLRARADPRELGLAGERFAARELAASGYRILARRLRTRAAEIDLLAEQGGVLWLIEVKTGRVARPRRPDGPPQWDPRGLPGRRLGPRQLARLESAARALLAASTRYRRAGVLLVEVRSDPLARALECRIHADDRLEVHRHPTRDRLM